MGVWDPSARSGEFEIGARRFPKVIGTDGLTALRGLQDALHLARGERLLIFGASGGIGHLAVQLAKRASSPCGCTDGLVMSFRVALARPGSAERR